MIGSSLGVYRITQHIGRGGMADVYLADDSSIGRQVAVKVLPAEFSRDPSFLKRFDREVKIIAGLQHSSILPVHAYGQAGGQPYIVMAYMPGGTLAEAIARTPGGLPLGRIAYLLDRLGSALDYAHKRGIIHRDFKPSNVLLDEEGHPYIADFGIAKASAETTSLTGSGIIGTPNYMAPEMAYPHTVSPLIDVYALGVSLYQMLTGQVPYHADTPMGVLMAHATRPIPDPRDLRPELSPGVVLILRQSLAKQPAERCQSAGALAAAFRATLEGGGETQGFETSPQVEIDRGKPAGEVEPEPLIVPPSQVVRIETSRETIPAPWLRLPEPEHPGASAATPSPAPIRRLSPLWLLGGGLAAAVALFYLGISALINMSPAAAATEIPAIAVSAPTPTAIPTRALAGVVRNDEWTPYIEEINGVAMALVPTGCFQMGSEDGEDDELPVHEVCFEQPFWIDLTEVTNAQFVTAGGEAERSSNWIDAERPRERITWAEATAFCERRGARLPTEAEWEYAARGPDGLTYPWGNDLIRENAVWNTAATANAGSMPAGASWVGALDMSGNVWEWVNDWYGYYPSGQHLNSQGPESGTYRVLRGGAWHYLSFSDLRCTNRYKGFPSGMNSYTGFRCAHSFDIADS